MSAEAQTFGFVVTDCAKCGTRFTAPVGAGGFHPSACERCVLRGERDATVKMLRDVCADFGDNDWADELHLADVIEKHLARHLWQWRKEEA